MVVGMGNIFFDFILIFFYLIIIIIIVKYFNLICFFDCDVFFDVLFDKFLFDFLYNSFNFYYVLVSFFRLIGII